MTQSPSSDVASTRVSTTQAVVIAIRKQILSRTLPPGTRLTEVEIAERYDVSRQTVRSAISELSHMGLVVLKPNRGVWVRELTLDEVEDLKRTRELIEGAAAAHAATHPECWDLLDNSIKHLDGIPTDAEWSTVAEADWNFHHTLVNTIGSRTLDKLHAMLQWQTCLAGARADGDDPSTVAVSHRALMEKIRSGDPDKATLAIADHLSVSVDMIRDRLVVNDASFDEVEDVGL